MNVTQMTLILGRARILGVSAQMGTFNYLFGVMLAYEILRHTDNLSKGPCNRRH